MSRPFGRLERVALWCHRRRAPEPDHLHGSDADEAVRVRHVDAVERARDRLAAYSDGAHPLLEAQLRDRVAMMEREGDVANRSLDLVRDSVLGKVAGSECARDRRRVLVRTTDDPTATASYLAYPDGSGLVLVCTGLMGLVDQLAKQFTLSAGLTMGVLPLLRDDVLGRAADRRTREDEYSQAVDVALLRWTLLPQRLYGSAASLMRTLPADAQRAVDAMNVKATEFVVAHECAHHFLGHPGTNPHADDEPADADHIALEIAADEQALDMLDLGGYFGLTDAIGALVAVMAVEYFERVAYVRAGHTHPRPHERANRILARLTPERRRIVGDLVTRVRCVADRAADLDEFVCASCWKTMIENDDVLVEPHTTRGFQQMFETDRIGTGPLENVDRLFTYLSEKEGIDLVALAGRIRNDPLDEVLRSMSRKPRVVRAFGDPTSALSFAYVHREMREGLKAMGVADPTGLHVAAITCSRLIERRIQEGLPA